MASEKRTNYLEVTQEQGARFFGGAAPGVVVMLNLLRFRERADYSHAPDLEPDGGCTGREAFARYMAEIEPLLNASEGSLLFSGTSDQFLIGPQDEQWDYVMLVQQSSAQTFMAFASDPGAIAATRHRAAAIMDSRLLPIRPGPVASTD